MFLRLVIARPSLSIAVAAACAAALGACASNVLQPPSYATGEAARERVYRLGLGDKVKVVVFGEDNLSGQFEVNPEGSVGIPLVGEVKARGLSLPEFREEVTRRLVRDGILKHPKVTADVMNYRPIYVHGEVKTGGEFQFKSGLRLRDAIAMAGGYTYRADQSYVLLGREDGKAVEMALPGDALILPGDNIRVPERFF